MRITAPTEALYEDSSISLLHSGVSATILGDENELFFDALTSLDFTLVRESIIVSNLRHLII